MVRATVFIVDDHADFRESARALLEAEGFAVIGDAPDGLEALDLVRHLRPDVVLLDVQLPGLDGFAVADRLAAEDTQAKVVLVSSRDATTYGDRLVRTSVRGFLQKEDLTGTTLAALL